MFNFFKKKQILATPKSSKKQEEDFNDATSIAKYFHIKTGITFDTQMSILNSKTSSFCKKRNIPSFKVLLENIKTDIELEQELTNHLTTNESYFYREPKQIMNLVEHVQTINSQVSILCAPSATGEEPYSLAIALLEAGVSVSRFHILGIDINSDAIQKSQEAVYNQRSLRNLSPEVISKYFISDNENYTLKDSVKSSVSFKVLNLFDDSFQNIGKFDFVFSRNMLIYFDKETKIKAKEILESMRKTTTYNVFFGHADLF